MHVYIDDYSMFHLQFICFQDYFILINISFLVFEDLQFHLHFSHCLVSSVACAAAFFIFLAKQWILCEKRGQSKMMFGWYVQLFMDEFKVLTIGHHQTNEFQWKSKIAHPPTNRGAATATVAAILRRNFHILCKFTRTTVRLSSVTEVNLNRLPHFVVRWTYTNYEVTVYWWFDDIKWYAATVVAGDEGSQLKMRISSCNDSAGAGHHV